MSSPPTLLMGYGTPLPFLSVLYVHHSLYTDVPIESLSVCLSQNHGGNMVQLVTAVFKHD